MEVWRVMDVLTKRGQILKILTGFILCSNQSNCFNNGTIFSAGNDEGIILEPDIPGLWENKHANAIPSSTKMSKMEKVNNYNYMYNGRRTSG